MRCIHISYFKFDPSLFGRRAIKLHKYLACDYTLYRHFVLSTVERVNQCMFSSRFSILSRRLLQSADVWFTRHFRTISARSKLCGTTAIVWQFGKSSTATLEWDTRFIDSEFDESFHFIHNFFQVKYIDTNRATRWNRFQCTFINRLISWFLAEFLDVVWFLLFRTHTAHCEHLKNRASNRFEKLFRINKFTVKFGCLCAKCVCVWRLLRDVFQM